MGAFDDLIPAGDTTATATGNAFADLIPKTVSTQPPSATVAPPSAFPRLSPAEVAMAPAGIPAFERPRTLGQAVMGGIQSSPLALVPPVRAEEPAAAGALAGLQPFTGLPPEVMAAAVNEAKGFGEFATSPLGKMAIPAMVASPIIRRGLSLLFGGQLAWGAKKKIAEAKTPQDVMEGLIEGATAPVVAAGALPRRTVTETTPPVPKSEIPAKPSATGILPAVRKVGGETVVGEAGQTHLEIMAENKIPREEVDQRAFVDQATGQVLDREQAAAATPQLPTATEPGRRHSTDLPEAKAEPTTPQESALNKLYGQRGVYDKTERTWIYPKREDIVRVIEEAKATGLRIEHQSPSKPEYAETWRIYDNEGNVALFQREPEGRTIWHGFKKTPVLDKPTIPERPSGIKGTGARTSEIEPPRTARDKLKLLGLTDGDISSLESGKETVADVVARKLPGEEGRGPDHAAALEEARTQAVADIESVFTKPAAAEATPEELQAELAKEIGQEPKVAEPPAIADVRLSPADRAKTAEEKAFRGTVEGQKAMVSRASRIAVLQMMNEGIRKLDPNEAYPRELIEGIADSQIDKWMEDLRQTWNKLKAPSPPAAAPAAEGKEGESVVAPTVTEIQAQRTKVENLRKKLKRQTTGKNAGFLPPPIRAETATYLAAQEAKLEAMVAAFREPTPPTPEPAAKKVEAEVKKVAATEGQRPAKEVKSELVQRLEDAVNEAHANTEDYFPGLYVYEARTLSETTRLTDRPVAGTRPLADWLNSPMTKKDKKLNRDTMMGGKFIAEALTRKKVSKVTIDIPGDGSFTVWNTKDNLQGLLDRARKISTSTTQPKTFTESKPSHAQGQEWMAKAEQPKPAAPPETGPTIGPGPGARTAGTDFPPGAQIEQLSQEFRRISAQKTSPLQRVKEAFDFGKKRELSQNLIARTLSALKTSGDYLIDTWRGQLKLDPILKAKGELSAELETRSWRLRQAMRDMRRAVPSKAAREAIGKYVDAGGNPEILRQSAETVPASRRAAYLRALQLTPEEKLIAGHIRSYFEARLEEAIDAGVFSHGIEDYIHRVYPRETQWKRGVINSVQNSLLDTRTPALAKKRLFELDADAERAGYLPVSDFIPRVLDYEASLSKVIASRAAVKKFTEIKMPDGRPMLDVSGIGVPVENPSGIREATLIKPSFKPGQAQFDEQGKPTLNYRKDYQSRDYPALKKWRWATNDPQGNPIFVQGDVLIHPDAVHRIDALLEPSKVRKYAPARAALTVGSVFKQTMLDFSGFHQVQIAIHGLEHKVNPFRLVKDVDTSNPDVQGLLRGGMTLGGHQVSGMYEEGLVGRSLSRQIPGIGELMQSYHEWLFQNFIPRVKTTMAIHALARNRSRFAKELASGKMTEDALFHQTAKEANAAFGEQNYIMLERSKTAQDMARLVLLAPDFLEARARFALQAGTRLGGEQRMALLLGAITLYTMARLMNKALNDEWHFEPENMFSIIHNGKSYSIRTVQGDILHAIEEPIRFWLHRLNPTITRPLFELMSGRDEFGRRRSFWQIMGDTISNAVPISMRFGREQSIWTSLLNAFGGSVRRDNDISRVYQEAAKWKLKNNIRSEPGEFIYDPSKDIYRPLKLALLDGNPEAAAAEYQKLISSKTVTPGQALNHFRTYARSPFSGSHKNERNFVASLTKDQQHAYEGAKQEKLRIFELFLKARNLVPNTPAAGPWTDYQRTVPAGFIPD